MNDRKSPFDRDEMHTMMGKWGCDCGARVRQRRVELGFSRNQLAQLAGVTSPTISRIESGSIIPKDDLRWVIAECLLVSVDQVWPTPTRESIAAMKDAA